MIKKPHNLPNDIWGKWNNSDDNTSSLYSSLPHHICQVLSVAEVIIDNDYQSFLKNYDNDIRREFKNMVLYCVGMHDIGKSGITFQICKENNKHFIDGFWYLEYALSKNMIDINNIDEIMFKELLSASISHHKRKHCFGDIGMLFNDIKIEDSEDPIKIAVVCQDDEKIHISLTNWSSHSNKIGLNYNITIHNWLMQQYGSWFKDKKFTSWISDLYKNEYNNFVHIRNYIQSKTILADCYGSNTKYYTYKKYSTTDPIKVHKKMDISIKESRKISKDLLGRTYTYGLNTDFMWWDSLFNFNKNPMQTAFISNSLTNNVLNSILESETGSGKTEAVVYVGLKRLIRGDITKIIYTCPTNVLRNEITERMYIILKKITNDNEALLNSLNIEENINVEDEDDDYFDNKEEISFREKFQSKQDRFIRWALSNIIVTTYDQILLAHNTNKHNVIRYDLFKNSYCIFDEVHLYDINSLEWLEHFIKNFPCSYTLLSASLPSLYVKKLIGDTNFNDVSYPRIIDMNNNKIFNINENFKNKTFYIHFIKQTNISKIIKEKYDEGKSVIVFCNTVAHEQSLAEALTGIPESDIFCMHASYAKYDRTFIMDKISERVGKNGNRKPCVVFGNQTIQQGCNISCDVLISVPCIMTTFIQRLGRVKRFDTGDSITAECFIIDEDFTDREYCKEIGFDLIEYGHHLKAMVEILKKQDFINIPSQTRNLIDSSFDIMLKEVSQSVTNEKIEKLLAKKTVENSAFDFNTKRTLNKKYSSQPNTVRKNNDSCNFTIKLDQPIKTYYGNTINSIPITVFNSVRKNYKNVLQVTSEIDTIVDKEKKEYILKLTYQEENNTFTEKRVYYQYGLKKYD